MKKIFSVIVVCMFSLFLVACGKSVQNTNSDEYEASIEKENEDAFSKALNSKGTQRSSSLTSEEIEKKAATKTEIENKTAEYKAAADEKKAEENKVKEQDRIQQDLNYKKKSNTKNAGMYKVGTDIEPGEYLIYGNNGYVELSSDSTGNTESIISNENISGDFILTINEGQYLTLKGASAYPIEYRHPINFDNTTKLSDGMYRVGPDLPAGEYKLSPTGNAYVEISSNSSNITDSIISNDNFSNDRYITVSDGQYIKIKNALLTK
ncbi:hypothetical protein [Carnobacterium divergens]|uniref:hypothetical protein n=1 Tax=Carnobacterium divergens TaxID=2748 RepID=UPI0039B0E637